MNSDIIKLLPDSVANQIAAGEVIQRPASVIKELVENSIDAGATSVEIIIKDAGRTLIQVVDNGKGMTPTDARMAFERHATSKITSADDLYTLHTMGFRGEALPSIAAVAQIELRTMQPGDSVGTRLVLSESQFMEQEPCVCRPGTSLMVKNLFFHLPARRKFLKKDSVELSHIMHEFERLALVNTDVEFTFINNGETEYKLLRGNLKQRIGALFGKSIVSQIIPVKTETSMVRVSGFVGLPHHARRRGAQQYFFVNGRNMRHPYFHKAVISCYSELIPAEAQPNYFIDLEVDPSTIDVNIHPQKHEIKFENEQHIWQILNAAVKQALGKVNASGAIDFDVETMPDIPVFMPDREAQMPGIATEDSYNPFDPGNMHTKISVERRSSITPAAPPPHHSSSRAPDNWDKLYESFASRRDTAVPDPAAEFQPDMPESSAPEGKPSASLIDIPDTHTGHIIVCGKWIVCPSRKGMMIIDRHRAHVRILYDRYKVAMAGRHLESQKLLFPESITLTPAESTMMSSVADTLATLGYDVSFLGNCTWAVNAVPALGAGNAETLRQLVTELTETGETDTEKILHPAALAMARAGAVAPGTVMTDAETDAIVADLLSSPEGAYTPDGLATYTIVEPQTISKLFN